MGVGLRRWDLKHYLSIRNAAEFVDVSDRTIKRWMTRGLPFYRIGGIVRIRPEELEAYINNHSVSGNLTVKRAVDSILNPG
jgi:excisionase family DNA binding protein